jgi:uncharacterized protein YjbI with pentapeptide repeats
VTSPKPIAAPRPPVIDGEATAGPLEDHAQIARARLVEADFSGVRARGVDLVDCELRTCNVANLLVTKSALTRVAFTGCRMTGFGCPEAALEDVTFTDCLLDLAAFGFARLRRVSFENCVLRDADFREARFESVRFADCDLTEAWFSGARFDRSELRRCTLDGLRGVDGLRGAALEWGDVVGLAGTMAAALGIVVLSEG